MKKIERLLAFLLALTLSLTGCRDSGKNTRSLSFQTARAYTAEDLPLPAETGTLCGCCAGEDCMYLLLITEEEGPALYRLSFDGEEPEKMAEYRTVSGEISYRAAWGPFIGGDGGLWLWEEYAIPYYDLPEDFDGANDLIGNYYTGQDDFCHLRKLDPRTGRELEVVDLGAVLQDLGRAESLTGLTVDAQGVIYIATDRKIRAVDGNGDFLFTLNGKIDSRADETLALLPDGTAAALVGDERREVRTIDPGAQDWGEAKYTISGSVWSVYSGSGPYQFFCQRGGVLYGRLEGELLDERLLCWADAGVETGSDVVCFSLLEDGCAAVLTRSGSWGKGRLRLQMLTPTNELPSDGKIRLVYGTIGDDGWARVRIERFNASSDKYYVELRDYAEGMLSYHGDPDYVQIRDAALKRLSAEMIAGQVPDILDDREIPLTALARQGILTDLWPFIDGDPELGRDGVMSHVLECAETDGKLYRVFSTFRIDTLAASRAAAGSRTGWTLEEMTAAYGGILPEFWLGVIPGSSVPRLLSIDKETLLDNLLRMDLDRYVDWDSGECSFDSETFRDVLRLCAGIELPADSVPAALWEGQPAVYHQCLASLEDLVIDDVVFGGPEALSDYEAQMTEAGAAAYPVKADGEWVGLVDPILSDAERARETGLYRDRYPVAADFVTGTPEEGGYAAYPGFPTQSGSGSCFRVNDCLAITETCENKEGAWAFVRQLLLPDGSLASLQSGSNGLMSSNFGFPVNREDFERDMEPSWLEDASGAYLLDRNGERIEAAQSTVGLGDPVAMIVYLRTPGQAYRDKLMALYDATDHIADWDSQDLLEIITEQAQPYFAGDKSLDETVDLIQRRAALYVNENR